MDVAFEGLKTELRDTWSVEFRLDGVAWERLEAHRGALATAPLNLTRFYEDQYWVKGVGDALAILKMTDRWERMVDIGTGAGFPGFVLAVARPERSVVLVDARRKRADFLRGIVERLGLTRTVVVAERAEDWLRPGASAREAFDLATARAVGNFRVSAELTLPALRVGGMAVFPRGTGAALELSAESRFLDQLGGVARRVERSPAGWLAAVEKVRATPRTYPRVRRLGE